MVQQELSESCLNNYKANLTIYILDTEMSTDSNYNATV